MSEKTKYIEEQYGDIPLESALPDRNNPSFASLLATLEAVHTKKEDLSLLEVYYKALTEQNETSRKELLAMKNEENADSIAVATSALDMTKIMLDSIPQYIKEPTEENMATIIQFLLTAMQTSIDAQDLFDGKEVIK